MQEQTSWTGQPQTNVNARLSLLVRVLVEVHVSDPGGHQLQHGGMHLFHLRVVHFLAGRILLGRHVQGQGEFILRFLRR